MEWLDARAQGSPLFVTGLLRALLEEGGDLSRPSLHSLPEDLADRVQARLRGLDSADRALLELLTVLGYRAELGDLLRLSGRSLDDLGAGPWSACSGSRSSRRSRMGVSWSTRSPTP